jgi:2-amino-4-hydroxy-6-hydroxymethyldihydropteridine diphosphokinase
MRGKAVYLSLGSNLGDRAQNLERAIAALEREHIHVKRRSSIYETEPRDVAEQPWFLNMVVECETECFPLRLLAVVQRIEREMGRTRHGVPPRGPRLIDIDILLFGTVKMKTEKLEVPHPRMLERRFVLEPLVEIAPGLREAGAALEKVKRQIVRRV